MVIIGWIEVMESMNERRYDLLWKVYTWMLGTLMFWNYISMTPFPNGWYYADFALTMFGFSGFVMFVYKRKFLLPWIWGVWAFLMMGWDIYVNFFAPAFASPSLTVAERVVTALLFILLLLPEYIGLFLYAFRSRDIWGR
jgi:hypothetical protein